MAATQEIENPTNKNTMEFVSPSNENTIESVTTGKDATLLDDNRKPRNNKRPSHDEKDTNERSRNNDHAFMIQFHAIPGPNSTLPSQQNRDKDLSPNITMMIDSGVSHILVRNEHAHILKYITMSETNTQPFANVRSAKIGSELSPIGSGLLQIGPFCFPAYIFRDDKLQESLLGLNPLTKRGCSATFTNQTFSLLHDLNKEPILHGSKTAHQNSWRVAIQQYHGYPMWDFTSPPGFYETPHDWDTTICSNKRPTPLPRTWAEFQIKPEQYLHHPTWDLLSPAEFYETVREWD
jgi:hypothetical protein